MIFGAEPVSDAPVLTPGNGKWHMSTVQGRASYIVMPFSVVNTGRDVGMLDFRGAGAENLVSGMSVASLGEKRTLRLDLKPGTSGKGVYKLSCDNGLLVTTVSIEVRVLQENQRPRMTVIQGVSMNEVTNHSSYGEKAEYVFFFVKDLETPVRDLKTTANWTNHALFPFLALGGLSATRSITLRPRPYTVGSSKVTISVTDKGGKVTHQSFTVQVNAVNQVPVIVTKLKPIEAFIGQHVNVSIVVRDHETTAADVIAFPVVKDQTIVPPKLLRISRSKLNPGLRFVEFEPKARGFTTLVVMVCDGVTTVPGIKVPIVIKTPPLGSASTSNVTGSGAKYVTVGDRSLFDIYARDTKGLAKIVGGDKVVATLVMDAKKSPLLGYVSHEVPFDPVNIELLKRVKKNTVIEHRYLTGQKLSKARYAFPPAHPRVWLPSPRVCVLRSWTRCARHSHHTPLSTLALPQAIDMGFEFKFYGRNYTKVFVSPNGYLQFNETSIVSHRNTSNKSETGQSDHKASRLPLPNGVPMIAGDWDPKRI